MGWPSLLGLDWEGRGGRDGNGVVLVRQTFITAVRVLLLCPRAVRWVCLFFFFAFSSVCKVTNQCCGHRLSIIDIDIASLANPPTRTEKNRAPVSSLLVRYPSEKEAAHGLVMSSSWALLHHQQSRCGGRGEESRVQISSTSVQRVELLSSFPIGIPRRKKYGYRL
jgi:hypothetical protein